MLTAILKTFDTIVNIATTSGLITLSLAGIGLIVILIPSGIACGLTISNKVLYATSINKSNKYRKQYEKDQQTFKSFDKLYRKT